MFKAGGSIMIIRTYVFVWRIITFLWGDSRAGNAPGAGALSVYYAYDLEVSNRTRRIISFMHTKRTTY